MPHSALIFGYGYLGQPIAKIWGDEGWVVHAVTRNPFRSQVMQAARSAVDQLLKEQSTTGNLPPTPNCYPHPIIADVTDPATLINLPSVDTVLLAVGYDRNSGKTIDEVYVDGVKNVLAALPGDIGRLIYISTTGVYGNADGDWIDENTPPCPTRPGGIASLAAEELIRESQFADRTILLRLAGIYGPKRLPYLAQLRAGEPIEASQSGYLNLIHVYDAARIVAAFADPAREVHGPITYCVSDGHPVVREEYYREVANLLGAPAPTFVDPPPGSPRAARAGADKRVKNRRLMEDIGLSLLYPSYREGLAGILRE